MTRFITRRPRAASDDEKKAWFWTQTKITDNGCWEWQRSLDTLGYGCFYWDGRVQRSHRCAWLFVKGEIPTGKQVLHHCDNRRCVNVAHLYLGTRKQNMQDKSSRDRCNAPRGPRHPFAKFTQKEAEQIRIDSRNGVSYSILAAKLNVNKSTIARIVKGRGYRPT